MITSHSRRSANASLIKSDPWHSPSQQPEPYDLVVLRFEDGSMLRGTWTGKIWWGYDQRVRRSRELFPVAWRPWD